MRTAALAISAALVLVPATALPAQAATPVTFTKWVADPAGADRSNNTAYNSEYIVIKNVSSKAVNMTGWTVKDKGNPHTFAFPKNFTLKRGASITLHSGQGTNSASHVYFNSKRNGYVWNNTGDVATLRKGSTVMKVCTYKQGERGGTKTC